MAVRETRSGFAAQRLPRRSAIGSVAARDGPRCDSRSTSTSTGRKAHADRSRPAAAAPRRATSDSRLRALPRKSAAPWDSWCSAAAAPVRSGPQGLASCRVRLLHRWDRRRGIAPLLTVRHSRSELTLPCACSNVTSMALGVRARRAGIRRLHRRHPVLGRLQHRHGVHQHREVLHRLPRDARQRLRRAEIDHPLHQPFRRARDLPGLPRAAQMDRQDRAQDAGLQGSLGQAFWHDRHPREVPRSPPAKLALHEWARFKANDSLECRNCHSAASMDITKQSPRASVAHQRFLFPGEKTCIDCHKGVAHHLPDMRGVPGWQ